MKHAMPFLFLILSIAVVFTSCKDDDDDVFDGPTYTLVIDNQTSESLDIYLSKEANSGFNNRGTAASNGELSIVDLEVGTTYFMRGSLEGDDVEDFVLEDVVLNDDPQVNQFIITITE